MRTQHIGPLVGAAKSARHARTTRATGLRMAMNVGAMPWGQWSGLPCDADQPPTGATSRRAS